MAVSNVPPVEPSCSSSHFIPLSEEEIDNFFDDLDEDGNGSVSFSELEARLEAVLEELVPDPREHHLHHPNRRARERFSRRSETHDIEKGCPAHGREHDGIHAFLCKLMPDCSSSIPKDEFKRRVKAWNIPSQKQNSAEDEDQEAHDYNRGLSHARRLRAQWSLRGPKILFICSVIALQLTFGLWQLITYVKKPEARAALGWGVIVAKGFAGALYPTLFFMILSMSRWFATFCRRFYHLSRFVDWDRHQSFHVWMAILALSFATLHAIGHLTGTFLYGSRPAQQDNLSLLLGQDAVPKSYVDYVRSLPGWTGVTALGLFWTISILSEPHIRKLSYELFQLGHLLMFPMIGLLCAHGAAKLLQYPMLGFWLAFPTLLVVLERLHRLWRGVYHVSAMVKVLDDDTVVFTCRNRGGRDWKYSAGQFVFLQVPQISYFQWHPFTISRCIGNELQLHVKMGGDWTAKLRKLPSDKSVRVGIDGPFGAPAQRFYEYDRSLIIGAGVGVTPFAAIVADLEQNLIAGKDAWNENRRRSKGLSLAPSDYASTEKHDQNLNLDTDSDSAQRQTGARDHQPPARRVDFHWLVREKNHLLWFSDLLNRAYDLSVSSKLPSDSLNLNIVTHITLKREKISAHIFRYLLDGYRTTTCPVSALTGLKSRSEFGRPDFEAILERYYEDMKRDVDVEQLERAGKRVAVFFCGSPSIGAVLSDLCHQLTLRGRADGSKIRWDFRMEVFG